MSNNVARTFRQKAIGYSDTPMTIQAKIDGVIVHDGVIPTLNEPPPELPNASIHLGDPVFSWTANWDFAGTWNLEVTVTNPANANGIVFITTVDANYVLIDDPNHAGNVLLGGPTVYGEPYEEVHTDEQGQWQCGQMITDISIDGVPTGSHGTREWPGQPYIRLNPQQVATAVVHTQKGFVSPDPAQIYPWPYSA